MFKNFTKWSLIAALGLVLVTVVWLLIVLNKDRYDGDFRYSADLISVDNFYDPTTNQFTGEILSKTNYSFRCLQETEKGLLIENVFDVRKPSGEKIFKVKRTYGISAATGQHIEGLGDQNRTGYLFAPEHASESEFEYWHINYNKALRMRFLRQEKIKGLVVNRYESFFQADQTANLGHLPGVPERFGIELDVHLTMWVEPSTGFLIKYEDQAKAWYYDQATQRRMIPWNQFRNTFEELSISKKISEAKMNIQANLWMKVFGPGILIFLAIVFLLIGFKFREKLLWRLYLTVSFVAISGSLLTFLLHRSVKENGQTKRESEFDKECEGLGTALKNEVDKTLSCIYPLKSLLAIHPQLSESEYQQFAGDYLALQGSEFPIMLSRLVPAAGLPAYEKEMSALTGKDFHVFEWKSTNNPIPVLSRNRYCPITYIAAQNPVHRAQGYDLLSEQNRKVALMSAAETGELATSGTIDLVQTPENLPAVIVAMALYKEPNAIRPSRDVVGFLSCPIEIRELVNNAFRTKQTNSEIVMTMVDSENNVLYVYNSNDEMDTSLTLSSELKMGNKIWKLHFQATNNFGSHKTATYENFLLYGGNLLSLVVSIFLFALLTDDRKKVLETNRRLGAELLERKKAEDKLVEIEQFAYIASHDLQQPLRTVSNYIGLVNEHLDQKTKEAVEPFIKTINGATGRMRELIKDLLDYSRIGKDDNIVEVDTEQLLRNVREDLATMIQENKAQIIFNHLPKVKGFSSGLNSVFQNLINNSIKFRDPKRAPRILIHADETESETLFSLADNGIGMEQKYLDKVFVIFHRLHSENEYPGTGIGLAQCKKIIELHGGRIWVESQVGVGSTFFFTIPKR